MSERKEIRNGRTLKGIAVATVSTLALTACSSGAYLDSQPTLPQKQTTSVPPSTPSTPTGEVTVQAPATANTVQPATWPVVTIENPAAACTVAGNIVYPLSDLRKTCTFGRMVIGHTLNPELGKSTYLSELIPQLHIGQTALFEGKKWQIVAEGSYPKKALPDQFYDKNTPNKYLVTCDPKSGYTRWADGQLHANNNLVVTLAPEVS